MYKPSGILIVNWNSAGGILKYQTMAKLGETENTYFAIITGHDDEPNSGKWFKVGEVVYFDKSSVWEFDSAVWHGDVH